jgi:hypothetical protein
MPRTIGKQTFPTRLGGGSRTVTPSFISPEQTWRTFLAAIETGDRAAAADCLTPAALEKLGRDAESFPLEELRSMVDTITHIEDEGNLGPFWSISAARESRRPKWIFFERTADGEWKIAGI